MKKRNKVELGSIANGDFKKIDPLELAKSRKRISDAMKPIVREFKRKNAQSILDSRKIKIK